MLAKLGSNISPELGSIVSDATSIMKSANGIGYSAKSLTSNLATIYPKDLIGTSWQQVPNSPADWEQRRRDTRREAMEAQNAHIGRAHVGTPVTNAHLVCRLMLEKT